MSRMDEIEAANRERPLTDKEVDALYRAQFPSQTREAKRACYARNRDKICRRNRERYASDPSYRAHKQAINKASFERRQER